jgi:hypothetical protein
VQTVDDRVAAATPDQRAVDDLHRGDPERVGGERRSQVAGIDTEPA